MNSLRQRDSPRSERVMDFPDINFAKGPPRDLMILLNLDWLTVPESG